MGDTQRGGRGAGVVVLVPPGRAWFEPTRVDLVDPAGHRASPQVLLHHVTEAHVALAALNPHSVATRSDRLRGHGERDGALADGDHLDVIGFDAVGGDHPPCEVGRGRRDGCPGDHRCSPTDGGTDGDGPHHRVRDTCLAGHPRLLTPRLCPAEFGCGPLTRRPWPDRCLPLGVGPGTRSGTPSQVGGRRR
jgi:hypothetical protein